MKFGTHMQSVISRAIVAVAAAVGLSIGLYLAADTSTYNIISKNLHLRLIQPAPLEEATPDYTVLESALWLKSSWGKYCYDMKRLSPGQVALCKLPTIWRNCTQGYYLDLGTNVGVQLRKLYDPWQFPSAPVLGLFDATYGPNRSGVCAIGVEANPAHTPYLNSLNAYFQRKGYQAVVLTETAASVKTGQLSFYLDHGSPVEWGASLASGDWQGKSSEQSENEALVWSWHFPVFLAEVVRPMLMQDQQRIGRRPPTGLKLDVEGEEYALLPSLIISGALCDLSMAYVETHELKFRSDAGTAVNMTINEIEDVFKRMRRAHAACEVNYTHLDDETYLHADKEIPLAV